MKLRHSLIKSRIPVKYNRTDSLLIISITIFDWNTITTLDTKEMKIVVNAYQNSIYYIGKILVSNLVVPFIASSFILLAAVLGAISLVKERAE